MDVDPANPFPHQPVMFDETERFLIGCHNGRWERRKKIEDFTPPREHTASELAENEWVHQNILALERIREPWNRLPEMIDPH
jgi:hypothetical protein